MAVNERTIFPQTYFNAFVAYLVNLQMLSTYKLVQINLTFNSEEGRSQRLKIQYTFYLF